MENMINNANIFAKLLVSNIITSNKYHGALPPMATDTMIDRMMCYRSLVHIYGLAETMEPFMKLLLEMGGDGKMKRHMWDEFNMALNA